MCLMNDKIIVFQIYFEFENFCINNKKIHVSCFKNILYYINVFKDSFFN